MKVIWSPLAIKKLGDAAAFIALDNPVAAEDCVNDVFDKAKLLGTMPEMGRVVPELASRQYREIFFGHYRVIYRLGRDVYILTARNCRQLLADDDITE